MTAHYRVRVKTQQQKRNRNYDLVWYETDTIAVHLDVDAENWEEAKEKAQALLPELKFGYRYDYWPETVEELKPEPEPEPTPTILTRTPKGFRYKGV